VDEAGIKPTTSPHICCHTTLQEPVINCTTLQQVIQVKMV